MKTLCATVAVLALLAGTAQAHAFLDHAIPAVGSTVKSTPAELDLFFTEGVIPHFSNVTLSGNGHPVKTGKLRNGANAKELIVKLPKLAPGDYVVVWHATSVDTHKTEGQFHFVVAP